jgi:hypothetical protein
MLDLARIYGPFIVERDEGPGLGRNLVSQTRVEGLRTAQSHCQTDPCVTLTDANVTHDGVTRLRGTGALRR